MHMNKERSGCSSKGSHHSLFLSISRACDKLKCKDWVDPEQMTCVKTPPSNDQKNMINCSKPAEDMKEMLIDIADPKVQYTEVAR